MEPKFSKRVREVILLSREEALRLGHDYIGTEHFILGMIREGDGQGAVLLKQLGVPLDKLRITIEQVTQMSSTNDAKNPENIPLSRQSEKALKTAYLEAKIRKSQIIGTEHLLLSILKDEDHIATQILDKFEISYDIAKEFLDYILDKNKVKEKCNSKEVGSDLKRSGKKSIQNTTTKNPYWTNNDDLLVEIFNLKLSLEEISKLKNQLAKNKKYDEVAEWTEKEKAYIAQVERTKEKIGMRTSSHLESKFLDKENDFRLSEVESIQQITTKKIQWSDSEELIKVILTLKESIDEIEKLKNQVVKNQKYEEAAMLREKGNEYIAQLERTKKRIPIIINHHFYTENRQNLAEIIKSINLQKISTQISELEEDIIKSANLEKIKDKLSQFEGVLIPLHKDLTRISKDFEELQGNYSLYSTENKPTPNYRPVKIESELEQSRNPKFTYSEVLILKNKLDSLKKSWLSKLSDRGIDPYSDERQIDSIKACDLFIIDTNIWMNPPLTNEFEHLKVFLRRQSKIVKIPIEVLEEIEKKIKRANSSDKARGFKIAKSRLESFSSESLLELTGNVNPDFDPKAYADPILLRLLLSELEKKMNVVFVSHDFNILIKAREFIRRQGGKSLGLNMKEFKNLMRKMT